jgi:hypothetical protein
VTIRVGRDRHCFALAKVRIALDDVVVAKLLPDAGRVCLLA